MFKIWYREGWQSLSLVEVLILNIIHVSETECAKFVLKCSPVIICIKKVRLSLLSHPIRICTYEMPHVQWHLAFRYPIFRSCEETFRDPSTHQLLLDCLKCHLCFSLRSFFCTKLMRNCWNIKSKHLLLAWLIFLCCVCMQQIEI